VTAERELHTDGTGTLALDGAVGAMTRRFEGDDFALLVRRNSQLLYRIAYSLLRHRQDAEDVVQETLLKLLRFGAWKKPEDETAFLARAVWRNALSRLGQRRRDAVAGPDALPEIAARAPSPESQANAAQRYARIARLIDALPAELREPLVLSAIEELTSAQVAQVLEIPAATVRSRTMRARDALRERYFALYGERP
jgi:RNA polymerase sigma-70 factor, ECF subfamily